MWARRKPSGSYFFSLPGGGLTISIPGVYVGVGRRPDPCAGLQLDPVASVSHPLSPQLDIALFGELAGIAQQIEQDLAQPHGVDRERAEIVGGPSSRKAVLALLGKLTRGQARRVLAGVSLTAPPPLEVALKTVAAFSDANHG